MNKAAYYATVAVVSAFPTFQWSHLCVGIAISSMRVTDESLSVREVPRRLALVTITKPVSICHFLHRMELAGGG